MASAKEEQYYMKEKVIIFADVDNTLRTPGEPMRERVKELIHEIISLSTLDTKFIYCTAQPCAYMTGATTEWQTNGAWILGSTGSVLYKGTTMPPKEGCSIIHFTKEELEQFRTFMQIMRKQLPKDIFWSPNGEANDFVSTPFWNEDMKLKEYILNVFFECWKTLPHDKLKYFENRDAIDIMISSVDKANGMKWVSEMLNVPISNCYALGDSDNDLPILLKTQEFSKDYVVGNHKFKGGYEPSHRFGTGKYEEMLDALLRDLSLY